ncbi:hypothetical protein [Seohaeicola zhoushanensis]|uniref:Uncharacterized protein n=1 Tax=Seohaeicola zhoushanensis TaxID=1569283 RepID=A0A8J3M4X4_9RHOB|nr:hypothetical protein [Seohaeicola zhoushanensis]GHF36523.1 hypothetical protein GCM10017056_05460 [Seohaeicola zhoushanensis]
MTDLKVALSRLGREHGYYSPKGGLLDDVRRLLGAAAGPEPSLPGAEREARRLARLLRARARATAEVAESRFEAVRSQTTETWGRWWTALGEYGEESPEAQKARDAYLSALLNHDCELRCRLLDCALLIAESGRQEQELVQIAEAQRAAERACAAAVRDTGGPGAARLLAGVQSLRAPLARLQKAHARIVALAQVEQRRIETIKRSNDSWISDIRAKNLGDAVRKALKALGIAA